MSRRPTPELTRRDRSLRTRFLHGWSWLFALMMLCMTGAAVGQTSDFGDYSSFGSASSTRNANLRMGALVDAENSATTNATATGDDVTGSDDEDGVTVPAVVTRGQTASIIVNLTNASSATAYLNAWIDFNRNGVLTDSGEQIATNTSIAKGTSNANRTISFTVPSGASLGTAGVRVRLTSVSSPTPLTAKGTGEVEDYVTTISTNLIVGNQVWNDVNDNGLFDTGESGINNVQIQLWSPGADNAIGGTGSNVDTLLATTTTAGGGLYTFSGLTAGNYFVKVPTPPLSRSSSVVDGADNGEDNDNDGSQPLGSATSAYSGVFALAAGTEPGTSGGSNTEDTIDFGFVANVGSPFVCDNRFYIMQNVETSSGSGLWDTTLSYIDADQSLVPIFIFGGKKLNGLVSYGGYLYCVDQNGDHLYRINSLGTLVDMGVIDGFPEASTGQWGGGTALTSGIMIINRYTFSNARTTLYFIDLGSASLVGNPVICKYSTTNGNTTGNFGDIVWDPLTEKVYGYNTNDSSNLGLFEINTTSGICTRVAASYLSTFGSLTIDANGLAYGYGSQSSSTSQDTLYVFNRTNGILNGTMTAVGSGPVVTNSDGAACPGAAPSMKIGNLIWNDIDNDGVKESNESGINGVQVKLFLGGEDPLTATPTDTVTTAGGGLYSFNNLSPGQYFVYIPTPPSAYPLSSSVTDTADNSQDNDDNGIQATQGQPVRSPLISLVAGTESITDGDTDSNSDLTIDFGFRACPAFTLSGAPPSATVGAAYTSTFTVSGGTSPYTWAVASGTLPAGLTLSAAGALSGTPTASNGSGVSITVRATDALGCTGTSTFTLVVLPNTDFGDYSAFLSASSVVNSNLRIGTLVDAEASATTNTTATGDDITGSDDEDGVTVPMTLEQGTTSSITVVVTNTTGATAYLNAWVDFNRNGSLTDTGEQIAVNTSIANGSSNASRIISFSVPAGASLGASAIRVRLTSVSTPGADGLDGTGEVEDHGVTIVQQAYDYGDFADFALASNTASTNLRMGALVDAETSATLNTSATGDDNTGSDDEDAVTFPSMTAGQTVTLSVPVTNLTGTAAYFNAWMDFNDDGDVLDSGEQIATNVTVANGSNGTVINISVPVPTDAVTASAIGARFRLTSNSSPGSTGAGLVGEIEDYAVTILAPTTDFGDWNGAADASSTVFTSLRLGATVDREYVSTRDDTATGDDLTGSDDEDGVTLPSSLGLGSGGTVGINVTNTSGVLAYINAWIDFNGNGSFSDGGEQIINNANISNGTNGANQNYNFTTPSNAKPGVRGVRVRLTSTQNPGPTGASGNGEVEDYLVTINCPVISLSPATLTTPVIGFQVNQNFTANGGTSPYTFTVSSGILPAGLSLSSSGSLTGIATSTATQIFNVTAMDANGCSMTNTYTVTPVCPVIAVSPSSIQTPTVGQTYNQTMSANGGTAPYTWSVISGSLPGGLSLSSGGVISGTSTQAGNSTFVLQARDFYGCTSTQSFSVTPICNAISISPTSLSAGAVGTAYSQTFTASGGVAAYTYTISSGSLPAGLTLSAAGVLSGTPTAGNGSGSMFIVRAEDSRGCSGTRAFSLKICPVISLSPLTLTVPVVGTSYSQTLNSSGGVASYAYALASGNLPAGLSLSSAGQITGTPSSNISANFVVRSTDANGCTGTQSYLLQATCPVMTVVTPSLPVGAVGTSYTQALAVSGGTASYTWTITSGSLPAGLNLSSDGVISGTPTAGNGAGTAITFRVADTYGCSGTATLTLRVCPVITISPTSLPAITAGTAYNQTVTASGGASAYTFAIASGSLPTGLSLSSAGQITGTTTSTAATTVTIRATDANGCTGTRAYAITPICPTVTINTVSLPSGYPGASYGAALSAGAGISPYSWSLTSGSLPNGLGLSSDGFISGTPTTLGTSTFTVRAADANGCAATRSLTILVKGMSLGNLVWLDSNNNGVKDSVETGIAGATVQLFNPGTDNAIGGTGGAADTQVGSSIVTATGGAYLFANLPPGNYYVRVTPPAGYALTSGTPVTADNNVDNNNDGAQSGGSGTLLFSPIIALQPGTESTTDGDTDADTNLTVDFGLWASMGVGNMVFVDLNEDGWMNANEGVEGVYIMIFNAGANVQTDEAVSAAVTDEKGRYIITGLSPGSYFLHLAAIQFASGGPLEGMQPMATIRAGDDNVGQDLVFNSSPAVNGASTAVFTLVPGAQAAGTQEPGTEGVSDDDGIDANTDLTYDLGLVFVSASASIAAFDEVAPEPSGFAVMRSMASAPTTYVSWQETHPLDGQNGATDNPDADLYPNLLEYALGTDPANGASGAGRFYLESGSADAVLIQPAGGRPDIAFTLETSADGHTWTSAAVTAQSGYDKDGSQTQRYTGLVRTLGAEGFVRLKVDLDADLNGRAEATALTPAWMYSSQTFPVGTRTFSMPLEQPELYAGTASSRTGNTTLQLTGLSGVELTGPVALEILESTQSGRHFTVTQIDGDQVTVAETLPAISIGTRVALRPVWTLSQVLPEALFVQGITPETGDRVLRYQTKDNSFVPVWLSDSGWTGEDAAATLLVPGEALLVQTRTQDVTVPLVGQVPSSVIAVKALSGTRFLGTHQVLGASPKVLHLTAADGFPAAEDSASSTRLRLWKSDANALESGYDSLYLAPPSLWLREGDVNRTDLSEETLLQPFHGFFLVQP